MNWVNRAKRKIKKKQSMRTSGRLGNKIKRKEWQPSMRKSINWSNKLEKFGMPIIPSKTITGSKNISLTSLNGRPEWSKEGFIKYKDKLGELLENKEKRKEKKKINSKNI